MQTTLLTGYSRRIISPPKGIYLIGYGDRLWGNRGIHDDITASALAISDGDQQFVILACDLLAINELTLQRVIEKTTDNIMVCCSHTHSGPIVYADQHSSKKNRKYVDFLVSQLIEVIHEAQSKPHPSSLYLGTSTFDLSINRRERKSDGTVEIGKNLEGFVDKSVNILQVRNESGKPFVNIVNMACHNVVLGPSNYLVSADWAGDMRRRIEDATGTPCLFIQGAAADLNPDHEWSEDDFDAVSRIGKSVASSVLSGFSNLVSICGDTLKYHSEDFWLQLESQANQGEPPKNYRDVLSDFVKLPKFMVDPILNLRYPWKTEIREVDGYWSIPIRISCLQLGEIIWVGLGAEVFTQIGWIIKEESGSNHVIFSSLTNGCIGYLPTEDEHALGGYEVDLAPYFYRLPGRLQPNSAKRVIQRTLEIMQPLRAE